MIEMTLIAYTPAEIMVLAHAATQLAEFRLAANQLPTAPVMLPTPVMLPAPEVVAPVAVMEPEPLPIEAFSAARLLTLEEVRLQLKHLMSNNKQSAVALLIQSMGATRLSELTPDQWPELLARAEQLNLEEPA